MANIKANGVLVPVVAHRTGDGTLRVLYGQRRTLAAVKAGLAAIPVYVTDTPEEADRLAGQVAENDQRTALTDADRAEAFHQMALLGVSAATIAKKAGASDTVTKAIKARGNEAAVKALTEGRTLDQALVLAEFEADEDARAELESVLADEPHYFEHVAQQLRDKARRHQELADAKAECEARGLTLVDEIGYYDTGAVASLTCADGTRATTRTPTPPG